MRLAIVGGTGKLGSGLAQRWARAGHTIALGSRDAAKARAHAEELSARGLSVLGGDNAWAAGEGEVAARVTRLMLPVRPLPTAAVLAICLAAALLVAAPITLLVI